MKFAQSASMFKSFLKRDRGLCQPDACSEGRSDFELKVGVLICPWANTPVPWYSITLALLLRRRGLHPYLIWDDLSFEQNAALVKHQNIIISEVLDIMKTVGFDVVRLSDSSPVCLSPEEEALANESALLNAQWIRTTSLPGDDLEYVRKHCYAMLSAGAPRIAGFLNTPPSTSFLIPGGVYRYSGLFLGMAVRRKFDVSTYDSGSISMAVGRNHVAARFRDLPETFGRVAAQSPEVRSLVFNKAKAEFHKRLAGKDKYQYQQAKSGCGSLLAGPHDVFIPLNIETDATALGLSRFFETSWDWLVETLDFLLQHTAARVAVRQHPYEAKKPGDRTLFTKRLVELFPSERLTVYSCYDRVNSYDILGSARVVLPYVSSMGIEAAMLGKEVIMESRVYYAGMPFAPQATSKEDYFERIACALDGCPFNPLTEDIEAAWLVYYLSAVCGRIWTDFTPQPGNFERWSQLSLDSLEADETIQQVLEALSGGRSVTTIQHEKFLLNVTK
ncbi:MAG: hypothetical protein KKE73_16360 [Proteobacteria bacterium]|nr:hypothetical protein [Pseudomonadota bacterium]